MAPKITFAMTYCQRDAVVAQKSEAALQALYPDATVLLIEDSPRLKLAAFAGQWTERWMTQALATGADIIVKLDPDTRAKRVAAFPSSDLFGQLAPKGTYWPDSDGIISGGAIGFKASAVKAILDSGFLRDKKYRQVPYACAERRYGVPRELIALQDPIVHDITVRLGLSEGAWDGLFLRFSWEPPVPVPENATFVHPVKE